MKTIEIEIALMQYLNVRQNIIVPNVFWGMGLNYECDLVKLSKNNYATEIEIKISKSDLMKDNEKKNCHNSQLFKYLYFAVPEKLKDTALNALPSRAGLYVIINRNDELYVKTEKKPIKQLCKQWSVSDRYKLAELGAMRILGLKKKVFKNEKNNSNGGNS